MLLKCVVIFFVLFFDAAVAYSADFSITPFGFYEQASSRLVVNNVSSQYALGVMGGDAQLDFTDDFSINVMYGYGQAGDQSISFSGASFIGSVEGNYSQISLKHDIWSKNELKAFLQYSYSERSVRSDDLVGSITIGNRTVSLFGSATTALTASEVLLGLEFLKTKNFEFQGTAGLSNWRLESTGIGYTASQSVTATKSIDTRGLDPVLNISLNTTNLRHNFAASISYRSLQSEAGSSIVGVQARYLISF